MGRTTWRINKDPCSWMITKDLCPSPLCRSRPNHCLVEGNLHAVTPTVEVPTPQCKPYARHCGMRRTYRFWKCPQTFRLPGNSICGPSCRQCHSHLREASSNCHTDNYTKRCIGYQCCLSTVRVTGAVPALCIYLYIYVWLLSQRPSCKSGASTAPKNIHTLHICI